MKIKNRVAHRSKPVSEFKKRLIEVLDQEQQVWWSNKLKVSQSVLSGGWKKKSYPRSDNLLRICEIKGISANWLLLGIGPKYIDDLDERKIAEIQNKKNETQYKIMEQSEAILALKERISELERALDAVELSQLAQYRPKMKHAEFNEKVDIFNENILPLLTLMRLLQDILFKVIEEYSRKNMTNDRYRSIFDYLTDNFEAHKYSIISSLKELDKKFK